LCSSKEEVLHALRNKSPFTLAPALTELKLDLEEGDEPVGDEGAKAISDSLQLNSTLTELSLSEGGIGVAGGKALSRLLKENTTLTTLNLNSNSLGIEGGLAIACSLKTNRSLTDLSLVDTNIGGEGAKALSDSLKSNASLTNLNLDESLVRGWLKQYIKMQLTENRNPGRSKNKIIRIAKEAGSNWPKGHALLPRSIRDSVETILACFKYSDVEVLPKLTFIFIVRFVIFEKMRPRK